MERPRRWCFTLNNPEKVDEPKGWFEGDYSFLIWQLEKGENNTPHLQGYIEFEKQMSFKMIRKGSNEKAHWEKSLGSPDDNIKYCSKEPKIEGPWRIGEPKSQGKRNDIVAFKDAIKRGATNKELVDDHTVTFVKYPRAADMIRAALVEPRNEPPEIIWYWGSPGSGKSKAAFTSDKLENIYPKNDTKWWCGYWGQPTVVLDDVRPKTFNFTWLLRFLDRNKIIIETKGGHIFFNSKRIIVTSSKPPIDFVPEDENPVQILRRLTKIICTDVCCTEVVGNTIPQLEDI